MRWIFYTLVVANLILAVGMLVAGFQQEEQPVASPVEPPVEPSVPQIRLLNEVERYAEGAREVPATSIQPTPRSCMMAGPFSEEEAALQVSARLLAHGMSTELKKIEKSIGDTFWVFLDIEDEAAANNLHTRLQARGVDNFVITEGLLAGRIALGVFSQGDQAREHRNEMLRRGLQAELKKVSRSQTEFWVAVTAGNHIFLEDSRWKSLFSSNFKRQQKENFCLDVASR